MENLSNLTGLAQKLHFEFVSIYYYLLPVFFMIAIAIDWFRNPAGSPDFLETLKRAVISTLLVAGFQEMSQAILAITSGIADRISDMSGIDTIIQMASDKVKNYPQTPFSLVLGFNDLVVALLSFLSYVVLYIARYITVALYHFMWIFLSILAPILMLFNMFRGTAQIPINLFKSLIEVASYKIVWAVLSAMITTLSLGNSYAVDGNYLTIIILNFIIALAMLRTPAIIKSLVGGGLSGMSESLGMGAVVAMVSAPAKAAAVLKAGREVVSYTAGFASHHLGLKNMTQQNSSQINTQNTNPTPPPPPFNQNKI